MLCGNFPATLTVKILTLRRNKRSSFSCWNTCKYRWSFTRWSTTEKSVYEYFTLSFPVTVSLLSEDSRTFSEVLEDSLEPTLCSKPIQFKTMLSYNYKIKQEIKRTYNAYVLINIQICPQTSAAIIHISKNKTCRPTSWQWFPLMKDSHNLKI